MGVPKHHATMFSPPFCPPPLLHLLHYNRDESAKMLHSQSKINRVIFVCRLTNKIIDIHKCQHWQSWWNGCIRHSSNSPYTEHCAKSQKTSKCTKNFPWKLVFFKYHETVMMTFLNAIFVKVYKRFMDTRNEIPLPGTKFWLGETKIVWLS